MHHSNGSAKWREVILSLPLSTWLDNSHDNCQPNFGLMIYHLFFGNSLGPLSISGYSLKTKQVLVPLSISGPYLYQAQSHLLNETKKGLIFLIIGYFQEAHRLLCSCCCNFLGLFGNCLEFMGGLNHNS